MIRFNPSKALSCESFWGNPLGFSTEELKVLREGIDMRFHCLAKPCDDLCQAEHIVQAFFVLFDLAFFETYSMVPVGRTLRPNSFTYWPILSSLPFPNSILVGLKNAKSRIVSAPFLDYPSIIVPVLPARSIRAHESSIIFRILSLNTHTCMFLAQSSISGQNHLETVS